MSDRRDGFRMNRRRLLAAISTVGAAGALTGRGAAAYLTDRETLADNRMTAGTVTLALDSAEPRSAGNRTQSDDGVDTGRASLDFTVDDYGFENRDAETVCLGLGEESNPGWVWIRACPVRSDAADALDARLTVGGSTVYTGTLGDLLAFLSGPDGSGVLLSDLAGDGDPVTPGTDGAVCLTVAIWAPTTLADDPGTVRALKAASPLSLGIDAYAEQSRHVPTPRRPAAGLNPSFAFPACEPTGGTEGGDDGDGDGYAISNVSLCTPTPVDPAGVTWTVHDPETGADVTGSVDEPFVVRITSPVPVDYAVVKAGLEFRRFDVGGETTFTVSSTGGTLLDVPKHFATCACEGTGVKLDWIDADADFGTPVALSCGGDGADEGSTDDGPSGGPPESSPPTDDPPTGSPPGDPPGPNAQDTRGTDDGSDDAPATNGGGTPPNGDDK